MKFFEQLKNFAYYVTHNVHILTVTISTSKYREGDQYLDWRVDSVFLRVSRLDKRR